MRIFSSIKQLFNKNIDCGEDMSRHIVFFLKKRKYIYLNKNIIVRDGVACVVVYKRRVTDVILPGKYKIDEQIIPTTYHKAKIDKKKNKGAKVKRIRVDLYFVNTTEIKDFEFDSYEPFHLKSKEIGRYKGLFQGICTLRVIDPEILIRNLIAKTGVAKTKNIPNNIGFWVGNKINKKIQKDKVSLDMIFSAHDRLNMMLNDGLEDAYDNYGIFIKNICIKSIKFSKKYQKRINQYLASRKNVFNSSNIANANWQVKGSDYTTVSRSNMTSTNNTMQNIKNNPSLNRFKICHRCGFKNDCNAINCRNCNFKF